MSTGAVIFDGELRMPLNIISLRRFRKWAHSPEFPDLGKICYIAGEIEIDMSPEYIFSHSRPKRDLSTDLNLYVRKRNLGELLFDGVLLVNEHADLGTEPDLMFCSWQSLKSGRGRKDYTPVAPDHEGYRKSPVFSCRFRIARKRESIGYSFRLRHRD